MNRRRLLREYCIIHIVCGIAGLMMGVYWYLQYTGLLPALPCVFLQVTHLYCPGCGGTRAFMALLHGHLVQSLRFNPAILLGLAVICYYEAGVMVTILRNDGKCYYDRKGIPLYLYLAVIIIFAVVRNVLLVTSGTDWLQDVL